MCRDNANKRFTVIPSVLALFASKSRIVHCVLQFIYRHPSSFTNSEVINSK
jgi:hypothetical protein